MRSLTRGGGGGDVLVQRAITLAPQVIYSIVIAIKDVINPQKFDALLDIKADDAALYNLA